MTGLLHKASVDDMRETASRICRDYLTGRWKETSAEQLIVKRISGGLSNYLYYVSLPSREENFVEETIDELEVLQPQRERLVSFSLENGGGGVGVGGGGDEGNSSMSDDRSSEGSNDLALKQALKRKRYDSSSSGLSSGHQGHSEPQEVLLRIYGQSHGEDALETMITESVVFALLSERNFVPKLHGIFPGGRIEQYIPARALKTEELGKRSISLKVAEKMADIHTLNIPMSKEPDWIWNCMQRWQRQLPAILAQLREKSTNGQHSILEEDGGFDFNSETKWLRSVIAKGQYPVVFCHNDLQEGNILIREHKDGGLDSTTTTTIVNERCANKPQQMNGNGNGNEDLNKLVEEEKSTAVSAREPEVDLFIIDFEYCAYNYRGFDLANHFLEWTFDYSNPEYPFYHHYPSRYPSQRDRIDFIKVYLRRLRDDDLYDSDCLNSSEEIDAIESELLVCSMLSHLFWSLWSVVNTTSNIEFGYWSYAMSRIKEYQQLKKTYLLSQMNNV